MFSYTSGLAEVYLQLLILTSAFYVGVPLSPCRGAEKAFNFVSLLSHMLAAAKSSEIRKTLKGLNSFSVQLQEKREVEQGSGGMLIWVS